MQESQCNQPIPDECGMMNKFMIHIQGPPDLTQSRRFEVSQLFYSQASLPEIRRSKSVEFVPFLHERDKLGRLLASTANMSYHNSSIISMTESKILHDQPTQQEWSENPKIQRVVQQFFKKIDMESRELARGKFVHKKIVILAESNPKDKPKESQYDITRGLNQTKSKIRDIIIKKEKPLGRPQSLPQPQKHASSPQLQSRSSPQPLPSSHKTLNSSLSSKPTPSPYQKYKTSSVLKQLKVKLNPEQLQYKRYKQQQQSSLKVFEDYEEGHNKFKQKMKESKQIAYRIKKELQLQ